MIELNITPKIISPPKEIFHFIFDKIPVMCRPKTPITMFSVAPESKHFSGALKRALDPTFVSKVSR